MQYDTPARMNQSCNIAIVGGGVIGLSIARALALRGVPHIALFERAGLGTEASFAAAGMLAPQAEADMADSFFHFACASRDMYPNFAAALREETGLDVELDTQGTLYLAFTENDQHEIEHRFEWQTNAGLPVEKLSAKDATTVEPSISPAVAGALFFPLDIQVENRKLVSALAVSTDRFGVRVFTETKVDTVVHARGRIEGLHTSRGFFGAKKVIIAAGTWTTEVKLVNDAGELSATPRIEPVRGQMICFAAKPQLCAHVIYSPRGYIVPRKDGRLLAGSTSEQAGFAKQTTEDGLNKILENAQQIAPSIAALPRVDSWAGLRPRSSDGLPVLGRCDEIDGLLYATGHYRNGILLAPITGELLAQAIVDEKVPPALAPFSPARFAERSIG